MPKSADDLSHRGLVHAIALLAAAEFAEAEAREIRKNMSAAVDELQGDLRTGIIKDPEERLAAAEQLRSAMTLLWGAEQRLDYATDEVTRLRALVNKKQAAIPRR